MTSFEALFRGLQKGVKVQKGTLTTGDLFNKRVLRKTVFLRPSQRQKWHRNGPILDQKTSDRQTKKGWFPGSPEIWPFETKIWSFSDQKVTSKRGPKRGRFEGPKMTHFRSFLDLRTSRFVNITPKYWNSRIRGFCVPREMTDSGPIIWQKLCRPWLHPEPRRLTFGLGPGQTLPPTWPKTGPILRPQKHPNRVTG